MTVVPSSSPLVLVAVDDHPLLLEGLAAGLRRVDPGLDVVAAGATTDAVMAEAPEHVDVVLLDLVMPRPEGHDVATDVRRWVARGAAVLVCTAEDKPVPLRRAVAAGAAGVVLKGDPVEGIAAAVRTAAAGEVAFSGELAYALVTDPDLVTRLSPREVEVLEQVASGATRRLAARELGIGERAVKEYLDRALARFRDKGVEPGNAHGLVARARAEGHLDG